MIPPPRHPGGFTAQREVDTESGLTFMRHRMYDPKLGRFTQTDPILGNRATKHYAYAANNPVSMIDPMGLDEAEWEAVKPYLLDVNWVKTHKKQPKLVDPNKDAIYSSGGQGVLQRAYESYQLALQTGDAVSAYYRLRDLEVGYMEGPDVLDSIYNSKEKLMQYLLIVQGSAAGINLQGLGSAQAINKMIQEMQPSRPGRTVPAKTIAAKAAIVNDPRTGKPADLAFGHTWDSFEPRPDRMHILSEHASSTGSRYYGEWEDLGLVTRGIESQQGPKAMILQAIERAGIRSSAGGRIKFNLQGLRMNAARLGQAAGDEFGITEWELNYIMKDKTLFGKTDFYLGGKLLGEAEKTALYESFTITK